VKATLAGARAAFGRRLVVVFQPHRYTRTRDLLAEFATSFNDADVLFLTSIYAGGELPIPGVTSKALVDALVAHGHRDVTYVEKRADLARAIAPKLKEGDIVLTLGAGDITQVGPELLHLLSLEADPLSAVERAVAK
jgi:UDP-N-acetylmuramate--alanine ligase